jgi:16S rRNA (guanine527-N7)-methyltransferase
MKRSAIEAALERHGGSVGAAAQIGRILEALRGEPDPQTTVPPDEWVDVHVADSLTGLEVPALREAATIADVGAGAGFPGLVLAASLAHARVDLIESSRRKAELIERLIAAGGLDNARVAAARAEEWALSEPSRYDAVTARAVAPLAVLVEYAAPLLRTGGVLVAWKGQRDPAEESAGAAAAQSVSVRPAGVLPVTPYPRSRDRHLHVFEKVGETPTGFPRRPGVAAKRPLAWFYWKGVGSGLAPGRLDT